MECTIALVTLAIILCNQPERALADYRFIRELANCSDDSMCPTWFTCTSQKNCHCGYWYDGEIMCKEDHHTSYIFDCYCMTYDDDTQSTYLGSCFYNCHSSAKYSRLPDNPKQLINNSVCTEFHRAGLLCGDCEEGYSPLVLSYNLSCVKCPDGHKNWWKFILFGFVPLTFFYFIVLLFNINVTSSHLHGIVWFSQVLSMPIFTRGLMLAVFKRKKTLKAVKVLLVFYSFWNLDLFRSVIPDICLNVTTLQALALDYLIAFYPFLLLLISYFCIKLYDRKICLVVAIWKPFRSVISIFRKSWKVQTSLIDAFASFFLLSYVKIMNVTMDLLDSTEIHQLGLNISTLGVFYSPTVTYFGHDHLPYAIFALTVCILFVIIPPIVLILYPFRCFQKCLSFIPLKWNLILHGFIDTFQGCYKDGAEPGAFDCRWFSALIMLIRLFINFMFATNSSSSTLFLASIILVLLYLIAIINIQPYKMKAIRYPSTNSQFMVFLSLCLIALLGRASLPSGAQGLNYHTIMEILFTSFAFGPLFYIIFLICYWLVSKKR